MEENKTKNDVIKNLAGSLPVNANKLQSKDFPLQRPQNDIANGKTSLYSEESRQNSMFSTPKEPINLNKGDTKKNHRTSHCQSSSLNSENKSLNPSSITNQN